MSNDQITTLFVTGFVPFELSKDSHGVFQRMRMMVLSAMAASAHVQALFLTKGESEQDLAKTERAREWVEKQLGFGIEVQIRRVAFQPTVTNRLPFGLGDYFGPSPLRTLTRESIDSLSEMITAFTPDLIVAHRLEMFRAVRMATTNARIPIVFDLDDIEHLAFARSVRSPPHYPTKPIQLAHVLPLLLEELRALRQCQGLYVCSDVDKAKLNRWAPNARVTTIPNGAATPLQTDKAMRNRTSCEVLFVGLLEYSPNAVGMEWFLRNVWPLVISEAPTARLNIVGRGGSALNIPDDLKQSVDIHGFVDFLEAMYQKAGVAICPLLSGGGTRIKIIEAASHKIPTVSTRVGAEGLEFENGKSIILADEPEQFAKAVVKLLGDQSLSQKLGEAAFSVFENLYDREKIMQQITQSMRHAVRAGETQPT